MDKTFLEQNSLYMKPIFKRHVVQACAKTLHIRDELKNEEQLVEAEKRAKMKMAREPVPD